MVTQRIATPFYAGSSPVIHFRQARYVQSWYAPDGLGTARQDR